MKREQGIEIRQENIKPPIYANDSFSTYKNSKESSPPLKS
jgi:hypothetical protein